MSEKIEMSEARCEICGAKELGGSCPICAVADQVVKVCVGSPSGYACHGCIARALSAAWTATWASIEKAEKPRWWSCRRSCRAPFWRVK